MKSVLALLLASCALAVQARDALPQHLADTGWQAPGVMSFTPQYPLWSDGADKRRWIALPPDAAIDASQPDDWQFPAGTRLWKQFAHGGKPVETRYIERLADGSWRFATYVWNERGDDAQLAPAGGIAALPVAAAPDGRYAVPGRGDCIACHGGAALTNASVATARDRRLELMPMANGEQAVYDVGYYNIGVRPTADDRGTDSPDPFGTSWSIVRMLQTTLLDPSFIKVPGAGMNCGATLVTNSTGYPLLSGSLRKTERTLVGGSFKAAQLRNIELTGPYFHNGGKATLFQVMEFYDDGGDFVNAEKSPLIVPLGMNASQIRDVIAFMIALTDERVRTQSAPFDHPQLFLPNGDSVPGTDNLIEVPPTGAAGGQPLQRFLNLNPFIQ